MKLTGNMVKRLMRNRRLTIRDIKTRHNITLKRIREVRSHGVSGFLAEEWIFLITGQWPPITTLKNNMSTSDNTPTDLNKTLKADTDLTSSKLASDSVKWADSYLNNVQLPPYGVVIQHLRYLVQQAKLSDLPSTNSAIQKADALLEAIGE
jgi:hypothetical protein